MEQSQSQGRSSHDVQVQLHPVLKLVCAASGGDPVSCRGAILEVITITLGYVQSIYLMVSLVLLKIIFLLFKFKLVYL